MLPRFAYMLPCFRPYVALSLATLFGYAGQLRPGGCSPGRESLAQMMLGDLSARLFALHRLESHLHADEEPVRGDLGDLVVDRWCLLADWCPRTSTRCEFAVFSRRERSSKRISAGGQ
jgi:hypothetical protein